MQGALCLITSNLGGDIMCDYCINYDERFGREIFLEKICCGFMGEILLSAHIVPEEKELRVHLCKAIGDEELLVKIPICTCPFCGQYLK